MKIGSRKEEVGVFWASPIRALSLFSLSLNKGPGSRARAQACSAISSKEQEKTLLKNLHFLFPLLSPPNRSMALITKKSKCDPTKLFFPIKCKLEQIFVQSFRLLHAVDSYYDTEIWIVLVDGSLMLN